MSEEIVIENSRIYTGWLKIKYPTGQSAFSQQLIEIFLTKISGFKGERFFKN